MGNISWIRHSHFLCVVLITAQQFGPVIPADYDPKDCTLTPSKLVYVENEVITCNADASPAATYEWFFDVGGTTGITGPSITVTSAIANGFNNLYCVASNVVGGTTRTLNCVTFGVYVSTSTTSTTTTEVTTVAAKIINSYGGLSWYWITVIVILSFLVIGGLMCLMTYKLLEKCWKCQGKCLTKARECRVNCCRRSGKYDSYDMERGNKDYPDDDDRWYRRPMRPIYYCCTPFITYPGHGPPGSSGPPQPQVEGATGTGNRISSQMGYRGHGSPPTSPDNQQPNTQVDRRNSKKFHFPKTQMMVIMGRN